MKNFTNKRNLLNKISFNTHFSKSSFSTKKAKILVISGPTSIGKTQISIEIAKKINGEIISADSVQVYKDLNIGSAKVSPKEKGEIEHHLVDIIAPKEIFSAGRFYKNSKKLIQTVLEKNKVPIFVGGNGFYIRWLFSELGTPPGSDLSIKFKLEEQAKADWQGSFQKLKEIDPEFAKHVPLNDAYRVARALEVYQKTGKPYSSFKVSPISLPRNAELEYDFRCFYFTVPRPLLYRVIDYRCEKFVEDGLFKETKEIMKKYKDYEKSHHPAFKSIGYKQAIEYLNGKSTPERFLEFLSQFQAITRQYVHSQARWFRRQPIFYWLPKTKDNFEDWESKWPLYYPQISDAFFDLSNINRLVDETISKFQLEHNQFFEQFNDEEQKKLKYLTLKETKFLRLYQTKLEIFSKQRINEFVRDSKYL